VADLEQVLDAVLLTGEAVNQGGFLSGLRGFHEVAEHTQDSIESLEALVLDLVFNSFEELGQEEKVQNDRCGKEGIFANVVECQGMLATHKYLGDVLVHCFLGVSGRGNVFDDDRMIDVQAAVSFGEEGIGVDDVFDAGFLGCFL